MLKNQQIFQEKAFSLLELSVVILVIGILITGVMKGGSLVSASRINSARSLTARSPVGEINGLTAWYETTALQSFGKRTVKNSENVAKISVVQLTESRSDEKKIEIWRDISPKCINNYETLDSTTSLQADYTGTCNLVNCADKKYICNALSQAVVTNRPYYSLSGINNLPSVIFEGNHSLTLDAFRDGEINNSTKFVVFSVDNKPASSNTAIILNNNNLSASTQKISLGSTNILLNNGGSDANISYNIKNTYILGVIFSGNNSYYKINNSQLLSATNLGTNISTGLTVGDENNSFRGKISEIIIFNRILKETEITEIFNYLGKKYKVQVL